MNQMAAQKIKDNLSTLYQGSVKKQSPGDLAETIFSDLQAKGLNWREILQVSNQILSLINHEIASSTAKR